MPQLCTPGVALAIVDNHEIAWAGGFGSLQQGQAESVTGDTLFQAGSVSKPVFALAVMRLATEGRIDLDIDVNRYLTSWRVRGNREWQPRVTLRQLLSHSAGTTVDGFAGYPVSAPRPTLRQVLDGVPPANNPPVVVDVLPGFQTRYSGGGTTIAQQAVIDVMGSSLPELMRDLILDPIEMERSTFEQPLPERFVQYAAVGHPWNGVPLRGGWHVYPEMGAAGLWTTACDLARLGVELLRIWRGDNSALGLDRNALKAMLRPQLPGQEFGQDFRGLGWSCSGREDAFRFGHRGSNEGYFSSITLLPARGKGAVILLNSNEGAALIDEIVDAIGREYGWPPTQEQATTVAMDPGLDYIGKFRDARGYAFKLTRAQDGLFLHFGEQPPLLLSPSSRSHFFAAALDLQVRFEADSDGVITSMIVTHGGETIAATKL